MEIDPSIIGDFLAALTALILAYIAILNKSRTETAAKTAEASAQIATTNSTMASAAPAPVVVVTPQAAYQPVDTRERDENGNLTTKMDNCSQWWLDKDYTGPEPNQATKDLTGSAEYALENARKYATAAAKIHGKENLDKNIQGLVKE